MRPLVVLVALATSAACNPFGPDVQGLEGLIAFQALDELGFQIFVLNLADGGVTQLTRTPGNKWHPAWSPNGSLIAFGWETQATIGIFVMAADGSNQRAVAVREHFTYWAPDWSPDGTRLAFAPSSGSGQISVVNSDGTNLRSVTPDTIGGGGPTWSPDGTQLAFWTVVDGNFEIFKINLDGTALENLTNHPAEDATPAWSPDGGTIAFDRSEGPGDSNVFVMSSDGTGQQRLTNFERGDSAGGPTWSADGTKIAFRKADGIYVMNADGTDRRRVLARQTASSPDWR